MGGGVGVVSVLVDLIQTPDKTRGRYKLTAAAIKSNLGVFVCCWCSDLTAVRDILIKHISTSFD